MCLFSVFTSAEVRQIKNGYGLTLLAFHFEVT